MDNSFGISTDTAGDALTIALSGELDLSGVPAFNEALAAIDPTVTSVIIDLSELRFIDSSGVACFVRARSAGIESGWTLTLRGPMPPVLKVLDVVDLGSSIEIVD